MPLNPSELNLIEEITKYAAANPAKPLEEQTIEDFRSGLSFFASLIGEAANIPYQDLTVTARDDYQIPIRIYNHHLSDTTPVLIYYPGCGYVLDLFEVNGVACSRIANYCGLRVILVNYRLAPENPLPASIYDGYDATLAIINNAARFKIDSERVFIGGVSSGAHCTAVISNLARKDKSIKIFHQILLNGLFDLTESNHEYDDYEKVDFICTRPVIRHQNTFFGISKEQYANPLFSPYFEPDLTELPPTTLIVSEYDGLRNDTEAYYKKLQQAGNKVTKIVLQGQTHNSIATRKILTDKDPAEVIAEVMKDVLA